MFIKERAIRFTKKGPIFLTYAVIFAYIYPIKPLYSEGIKPFNIIRNRIRRPSNFIQLTADPRPHARRLYRISSMCVWPIYTNSFPSLDPSTLSRFSSVMFSSSLVCNTKVRQRRKRPPLSLIGCTAQFGSVFIYLRQ